MIMYYISVMADLYNHHFISVNVTFAVIDPFPGRVDRDEVTRVS
jgi:hypothetical protein